MAGMSLPGALAGKTQMTGSDSKARRLKSSEGFFTHVFGVWAVMTQAGLSELGQHRLVVSGSSVSSIGAQGSKSKFLVNKEKAAWPFLFCLFSF